jgi:hypothetical protein
LLYYCGKNHINPSCWWESGGIIAADVIGVRQRRSRRARDERRKGNPGAERL